MPSVRLGVLWLILGVVVAWPVQAQEFGRVGRVRAEGTSYHIYTTPGKATIQVMVMGAANGGIYEIADGTDLGELLAVTGASLNPSESKIKVRLFREQGELRMLIYEATMEEVLAEPQNYPTLMERDVLMVEAKARNPFRLSDALSIITAAGTIALLVERFKN